MNGRALWFLLGAAVLLGGGATVAYKKTRGIRNNNPGNIDYSKNNPWQGQTGSDGRFAIFSDPVYGLRAMARVLNTYRTKHGLNTVGAIINRWAPPKENVTSAYVAAVSRALGVTSSQPLTDAHLPGLMRAIIRHENSGLMPYTAEQIARGIAMAKPA